jgi:hypothetical protein
MNMESLENKQNELKHMSYKVQQTIESNRND